MLFFPRSLLWNETQLGSIQLLGTTCSVSSSKLWIQVEIDIIARSRNINCGSFYSLSVGIYSIHRKHSLDIGINIERHWDSCIQLVGNLWINIMNCFRCINPSIFLNCDIRNRHNWREHWKILCKYHGNMKVLVLIFLTLWQIVFTPYFIL